MYVYDKLQVPMMVLLGGVNKISGQGHCTPLGDTARKMTCVFETISLYSSCLPPYPDLRKKTKQ